MSSIQIENKNLDLDTILLLITSGPDHNCKLMGKAVILLEELSELSNVQDRSELFKIRNELKKSLKLADILMDIIKREKSWEPICGNNFDDTDVTDAIRDHDVLKTQTSLSQRLPSVQSKKNRKRNNDSDVMFKNGEFERRREESRLNDRKLEEFKQRMTEKEEEIVKKEVENESQKVKKSILRFPNIF